MNLLLRFNNYGYDEKNPDPVTMVMATHNPDVEVYADRILYIKDGKIEKQVRNRKQFILSYEDYLEYLKDSNKNQIQVEDDEEI